MTRRFRCTVCGYVHVGDEPPDECPVCGAGREAFVPEMEASPTPVPVLAPAFVPSPDGGTGPGLVVLGGGIAGLSAVETARDQSPDAVITLVHRETALPYYRLSLTRYLAGALTKDHLQLRAHSWFEERRIRLVRAEARHLDRSRRLVVLDDGTMLPYRRLLVATGAHPYVPPIPGVRFPGVHVLRTIEDADAILDRARGGARCVCIGGGLLGLETAGALARRGLAVIVLEEAPRLLPRQLARSAAARLADHLGKLGIEVRTAVKVTKIVGDDSVRAVRSADGSEMPADLVVIAAGVRPNIELARSAGLAVNRGLVVDDGLQTNDPDVLAAGDVAEHRGIVWGLWTVAAEQGALAGRAMAGAAVAYEGNPPATYLKVVELPVFSIGRFEEEAPADRVIEQADEARLVRILLRDGRVVGGNLVGDPILADALRRAVQERLLFAAAPEFRFLAGESKQEAGTQG